MKGISDMEKFTIGCWCDSCPGVLFYIVTLSLQSCLSSLYAVFHPYCMAPEVHKIMLGCLCL